METLSFKDLLDILSNIVALLGIPIAIYVFINEKRRERLDREYGTYDALDQKYIEYLEMCLQNPELDVFDIPLENMKALSPEQERKEMILLTMLISNFERSFLMYRDQSTKLKKKQWIGWVAYMQGWCQRENFRKTWAQVGNQFDTEFMDYLNELMPVSDIKM